MSYSEVKKYQQNFISDVAGTKFHFNFKPLTKTKPSNKWKITCVNIAYYTVNVVDITPHAIWIGNCPLLTGFGNSTNNITSNNNILLGTMSAVSKLTGSTEVGESSVLATSFIVNEIKQDPFDLYWTHLTDPFVLDTVETAFILASFEITELELV